MRLALASLLVVAALVAVSADITGLTDCTTFYLSDTRVGDGCVDSSQWNLIPSGYSICANEIHMNTYELMGGFPEGPYFSIDNSDLNNQCTWVLNGRFSCSFTVYQDRQKTILIGSMTWFSPQFVVNTNFTGDNAAGWPQINEAGGWVNVNLVIDPTKIQHNQPPFSNPVYNPYGNGQPENFINFQSQNINIYFAPDPVGVFPWYPQNTPLYNRVLFNQNQLQLWLWGGDCFDPMFMDMASMEDFSDLGMPMTKNGMEDMWGGGFRTPCRHFGVDFAAAMSCNGAVIKSSCPGCGIYPAVNAKKDASCVAPGTTASASNLQGTCVSLSFAQGGSTPCV